jgi:hypothetical protein
MVGVLLLNGQRDGSEGGDMSDPKIEAIKEGTPEWHYFRQNYLDSLIEDFTLTGDQAKMRTYIEEGGDLDKEWIIKILADSFGRAIPGKKGGPRDVRNIRFYLEVEQYLLSEKWKHHNKKRNLAAALRHVGKNSIEPGDLDDRAVKRADKVFRKGKGLFIERFGRPFADE